MKERYSYDELEKHFTKRKKPISPFYGDVRIPRKLKKKVKSEGRISNNK